MVCCLTQRQTLHPGNPINFYQLGCSELLKPVINIISVILYQTVCILRVAKGTQVSLATCSYTNQMSNTDTIIRFTPLEYISLLYLQNQVFFGHFSAVLNSVYNSQITLECPGFARKNYAAYMACSKFYKYSPDLIY